MKCIETEYIKSLWGLFIRMKVEGSRFRVSPWGVPPLDYDGKPHLNEKLEMRNAKWWCGA